MLGLWLVFEGRAVLACMPLALCMWSVCAAAAAAAGGLAAMALLQCAGPLTLTMLEKAFSKPLQSSNTSRRPVGASPSVLTAFSTTILRSVRRSITCANTTPAACLLWMRPTLPAK